MGGYFRMYTSYGPSVKEQNRSCSELPPSCGECPCIGSDHQLAVCNITWCPGLFSFAYICVLADCLCLHNHIFVDMCLFKSMHVVCVCMDTCHVCKCVHEHLYVCAVCIYLCSYKCVCMFMCMCHVLNLNGPDYIILYLHCRTLLW